MCSVCWNQVRSFHGFYEFVKNSQTTFLAKFVKFETTTEPKSLGHEYFSSSRERADESNPSYNDEFVESKSLLGKIIFFFVEILMHRIVKKTNIL